MESTDGAKPKNRKQELFVPQHFKAVLFRRWVMIKRSWKTLAISSLGTVVFSALAIVAYYLMTTLMKSNKEPFTFNTYSGKSPYFVYVDEHPENYSYLFQPKPSLPPIPMTSPTPEFNEILFNKTFVKDTGLEPVFLRFDNITDAQKFMYENAEDKSSEIKFVNFGLWYHGLCPSNLSKPNDVPGYNFTILYNSTQGSAFRTSQINILRLLWKDMFGIDNDFGVYSIRLFLKIQEMAFAQLGPMLITAGLCSIIPLLISQPIIDINGEVRPFMVSCTLTILPYWLATFLVDFAIWIVDVTIVWLIFIICQITAFQDNLLNTWYGLVMAGPSFILFLYVFSFCFSSADSASRQAFLALTILLLVPMIIDIVRNMEPNPVWLDYIYALFPQILIQRILFTFLSRIGIMKQNLSDFFKEENAQAYLIFEYVDIVIYALILYIIEKARLSIQSKTTQRKFGNFSNFFKEQKDKHPVTEEVRLMDEAVHDPKNKWAVRIDNASRLFFNTAGQPIPAVNSVSLGVKKGSLFGFLGANGAGKTTLIKMITSLLPPSDGHIEINGIDISEYNDPTLLSICPQFNTHLCDEMTPQEHFTLYSLLFRLDPEEAKNKTEKLIKLLEIEEIKDKPLRDLSAGDVRKLAIALCFLGPAEIILLDEPTASLDPVARKHVHEMISSFKGEKTFMLCTHLLSEAESLCDEISIMIKGNVYTCGSPQYLSSKFGTEYKIDVALQMDDPLANKKCDEFFETKLPEAVLTIMRPKARIYSIPATATTFPQLFNIMQEGKEADSGFNYYTCSSSSLERVFMELVHMSECEDEVIVVDPNSKEQAKAAEVQAPTSEEGKSPYEIDTTSDVTSETIPNP